MIPSLHADERDALLRGFEWRCEVAGFSETQKKVARLVLAGYSNKEIAHKLFVVESTIKNHLWVMFPKVGAHDRIQFVLLLLGLPVPD